MAGKCAILMTLCKTLVTRALLLALTWTWVIVTAATHTHPRSLSPSQSHSSHLHVTHLCSFIGVGRPCSRSSTRRDPPASCISLNNKAFCCCCFHFRRSQSSAQNEHDHQQQQQQRPFQRLFTNPHYATSCCDEYPHHNNQMMNLEESHYENDNMSHDMVGSSYSNNYHHVSSLASTSSLSSSTNHRLNFETQESSLTGKRAHYNDALLKRILNGRSSSSQRWRRRTRRAAAALGIQFSTNVSSQSFFSPFSYWSWNSREEPGHPHRLTELNTSLKQYIPKDHKTSSSSTKHIPPRSSALLQSVRNQQEVTESNNTTCSQSLKLDLHEHSHPTKRKLNKMQTFDDTKTYKIKPLPMLYPRATNTPLTREEYDRAKKEWTERYTNLSNLRSTFGTNRNKFWGDFDPETTRKLYKTLLPRALLGLYEMGLWSPKDLAPLAYEARLAAKKYARERCVVPGRIMSMFYDGFRSWRQWGTWNVEGMSWDQVWYKYETQIIGELCKSNGGNQNHLNVMQEEITALVCLRILERSCITNEAIDRIFLKDRSMNGNNTSWESDERRYLQRRKRKAERDIARISAQLERDMEELLKTPVASKSAMMNWRESLSHNSMTFTRSVNATKALEPCDEDHVK